MTTVFKYPTWRDRKVLHEGKVYEYQFPISLSNSYLLEEQGTTLDIYFQALKNDVQENFARVYTDAKWKDYEFVFVPRTKYISDNYGDMSEGAFEIELHIISIRDETPEEIAKREATSQRKSETAKRAAEDTKRKKKVEELALLKRLKAKYE